MRSHKRRRHKHSISSPTKGLVEDYAFLQNIEIELYQPKKSYLFVVLYLVSVVYSIALESFPFFHGTKIITKHPIDID